MDIVQPNKKQATLLIIVGVTGDLARRKLLPAIEKIAAAGELPNNFRIIGITRQAILAKELLTDLGSDASFLQDHLGIFQMDITDQNEYDTLREHLQRLENAFDEPAQRLFYLSVPPQISASIIEHLGKANFAKLPHTKLLLEKPFGWDLASAQELIAHTKTHFEESQIYRIDHYLAKEMAQNLLVFRNENALFKRTWNKEFIERIDIVAAEEIGIEGRAAFYEQTGALRDVVQSHLLQLAALTLMKLPKQQKLTQVPAERLAALQQLQPANTKLAVRGQYKGYKEEVNNPYTNTETFVSLTLYSNDPRWKDVPIGLVTGKALDQKYTEVRIQYRQEDEGEANQLILRIQPKEGIEVSLWSKRPGYNRELEPVRLDFTYHQSTNLPEAYEQVLLDAIHTDHTLFISSEEVLASWRILEAVQQTWAEHNTGLTIYRPGSTLMVVLENSN